MSNLIPGNQKHLTLEARLYIEDVVTMNPENIIHQAEGMTVNRNECKKIVVLCKKIVD